MFQLQSDVPQQRVNNIIFNESLEFSKEFFFFMPCFAAPLLYSRSHTRLSDFIDLIFLFLLIME